ncbi:hypothetical protein SAY86_021361 [Trapa natans]|uniref:Uncharacterized protein n=1 Tax=Trapa natans TaxID=22666 RepID=A0AAN7M8J5_TRANT|nr:hypothetical protein SAY86_021361 [Trapa natans]
MDGMDSVQFHLLLTLSRLLHLLHLLLKFFVRCGGETRFRRLFQPFFCSHSSSNMLEVEALLLGSMFTFHAVVTNHMISRCRFKESKELLITISESKTDLSGQGFHIPLLSKSKDAILWMSEKAAFTLSVAVEWNSLHKLLVLTCKILQLW